MPVLTLLQSAHTTGQMQETDGAMSDITQDEFEPIAPEQARAAIDTAIIERLGADWHDEDTGWIIVHESAYLVRLNKGSVNLDFQCDLLGEVSVIEREASPVQVSGRLIAWMVLLATLLVAFMLAAIAGVLTP